MPPQTVFSLRRITLGFGCFPLRFLTRIHNTKLHGNVIAFGKQLVITFLTQYIFAGDPMAQGKAQGVADALSNYNRWLSHGAKVDLPTLERLNVQATSLANDSAFLGQVDEIWAAYGLTPSNTPAIKITENHLEQAQVRMMGGKLAVAIQVGPSPGQQPPPALEQQTPASPSSWLGYLILP
jgi:hypothetical protein